MTRPSPDGDGGVGGAQAAGTPVIAARGVLVRFDAGERVLHWANATLFLTLLGTGAALYVGPISTLVGRRELMKTIHVFAGVFLPVPLVLTLLGPWGRGFRADVRRLNRWSTADRRWLRTLGQDRRARLGKFNPGQKLNAAYTGGAIVVMLASGLMLRFPKPFADDLRTGATFVHDWIAVGLFFTISGHIAFALRDGESLGSMWRGTISATWARRHAAAWHDEGLTDLKATGSDSRSSDSSHGS